MMLGLGGSQSINAGFRIYLKNDFSPAAQKIKADLKGLGADASVLRDNMMGAKRMFTGFTAIAGGATLGMLRLAGRGADFGFKMAHLKAITQATNKELKALNKEAKTLAGQTIFSPESIASAMKFGAMAGQSAATLSRTIRPATFLAAATDTQLGGKGGAMDIQTNIMKGFGIADTRMTEVADILTTATLSANTNLVDLGRAIKYTASTAMDMGADLKTTSAMIMVLGNAGMQSSQAGTAVENMMRYFARAEGSVSTKAQAKAMGMMGFNKKDFKNADGSLKDWSTIFKMIGDASKNLKAIDKQAAFEKLFGVRGKRSGSALVRMSGDYDKFHSALGNSDGTSKRIAMELMDNLKGDLEKMTSAWASFAAAWSEALAPILRPILQFGTWLVKGLEKIMSTPVLGTLISGTLVVIGAFATLAAVIGLATASIATMGGMFGKMRMMFANTLAYAGMPGMASRVLGGGAMFSASQSASGVTTKFSNKRGMYYSYGGAEGSAARWHKKGYKPPVIMGNTKTGKVLGRIGGFLGKGVKLFGRLIPGIGTLISVISILTLAWEFLGPSIMDLIRGTDDNTRAIQAQMDQFYKTNLLPNQAITQMYSGQAVDVIAADILKVLEALKAEGATNAELSQMSGQDLLNALTESKYNETIPQTK